MFVQLISMFTVCAQISNRTEDSKKQVSTAYFSAVYENKRLDLKQNAEN